MKVVWDAEWSPEPGDPGPGRLIAAAHRHHPATAATDGPIARAWRVAARAHAGQRRKSGHPYIVHPLAVAEHVADLGADIDAICAAVLHDTVEDTPVTLEDVRALFGDDVALIVDGVTKLDKAQAPAGSLDEAAAANLKKMIVALATDIRVLVVKLCDRAHNIATLGAFTTDREPGSPAYERARAKQLRIATETMQVYVPLAARLGLWSVKAKLEDEAFAHLDPDAYQALALEVARRAPNREMLVGQVCKQVSSELAAAGINATVTGRSKTLWSTHRKMVKQGRSLDDIADLVAIRIICEDVAGCYAALGTIHALYPPLPGRFSDFIAMPKYNTYQSLHSKVAGPGGRIIEAQIRTHDMHVRAELGVAAHWQYKQRDTQPGWVEQLVERQADELEPSEFLALLRADLVRGEVVVLTPAGDVVTLPEGATAIDLAYHIHTELGHRCIGVKVNGETRPLRAPLPSGARVEILTDPDGEAVGPRPDWLDVVVTPRARQAIRTALSRRRRRRNHASVRRELRSLLTEHGLPADLASDDELLGRVAARLSYRTPKALFDALASDHVPATKVAALMVADGAPGLGVDGDPSRLRTTIELSALDRVGLLAEVAATVARLGVGILSATTHTDTDRVAGLTLTVESSSAGQRDEVVTALRAVGGVVEVTVVPAA